MSEIKSLIDDDIKENIDHSAICVKFAMMSKQIENKDKEINRLNNKVEELMELYTTERHCKDDYKSIIKEVREKIEKHIEDKKYLNNIYSDKTMLEIILETLDKVGSDKE